MRVVALILAVLTSMAVSPRTAGAAGCRRCAFGGLCPSGETFVACLPSQSACIPNGGILGFNSMPPNVPAYWTLFAQARGRRSLGRLRGRLEVWSDYSAGPPSAPGLPERCDTASDNFPICTGERAEFSAVVMNDRLTGVAQYPNGATCEFGATIAFGSGEPQPNTFTCRTPSGEVMSEGALRVQLIRLKGCKRRSRASAPSSPPA